MKIILGTSFNMGLYFQNVKSPKHSTLGNCTLEVAMPEVPKRGCFCYLSEFFSCMCSVNHNIQYLILLSIHGAFKWNTTEGISYLPDLQNTLIYPPPPPTGPYYRSCRPISLSMNVTCSCQACVYRWLYVCWGNHTMHIAVVLHSGGLFYTLEVRPSRRS